jgi:methyl-accepting chemotaxis protein
MSVKLKLLIGLTLLATIPMLVSITISTWVSSDSASQLLISQAQGQLTTLRDTKRRQIEKYLERISIQIEGFANSAVVTESILDFDTGFLSYQDQFKKLSVVEARKALVEYFSKNLPNAGFIAQDHVNTLSDKAALLQYTYIANNENPVDEKYQYINPRDTTLYSEMHTRAHKGFLSYMQANNIYDIYLISPDDASIIYTVRKSYDLGVSLNSDQFTKTELAKAFFATDGATDNSFVYTSDFAAYGPAFNHQTAFVATKIFSSGFLAGVLVFQLTSDAIDNIMTNDRAWSQMGLGVSGETYLVGADKKMRSIKRAFAENPEAYLEELQKNNVDATTIETIRATQSTVGTADSYYVGQGLEKALAGESGSEVYLNTKGERILSAYEPLNIPNLQWAVLTEIEEREANASVAQLSNRLITLSAIAAIIMTAISVFFGWLFTTRLVRPIDKLAEEINYIESHSDLSFTISGQASDLTIDIVNSMNKMLRKIHGIVSKVANNSDTLSEAAASIDHITTNSYQSIEKQMNETDSIATEISTMTEIVRQMSSNADAANKTALTANDHANSGHEIVNSTTRSVGKLGDEVSRAAKVIEELAEYSTNVGSVLNVISSIADQTNLLALNAAIEAARAGEQGRGFAVVADEVRTLASRTQASTTEIKQIVDTLNTCATNAVEAMNNGREQSVKSTNSAAKTTEALQSIVESIGQVTTLNKQIEQQTGKQHEATESVSQRILTIRKIAKTNTEGAQQTRKVSEKINSLTADLKKAVAQFKL